MTDTERRLAAKQFAADWQGRGDEKQETQTFWLTLLQRVYGVAEPDKLISFEKTVAVDDTRTGKRTTKFIDGYIGATRVLIEQKGAKIDLNRGELQSDGALMSPYQQARRYGGYLPVDQQPRWIVVCNFKEFRIHDMNRPNDTPEVLLLADLEKEYHRLNFLVDTGDEKIRKEMEISLLAGELVGTLYDALLKQYAEPEAERTLKSLNALCVRLVFCLYAEDAGIFGRRDMFHDYLKDVPVAGMRKALVELFRVLDQRPEERDRYLADDDPLLAAFPYVNGGLFADETIEIPPFTEELKEIVLSKASEDFDWSVISPTIFGAVFESTLNPETRRKGGMHYTSIENIHKVIDPLFLDGLRAELAEIRAIAVDRTRDARLRAFQKKLAELRFLDPACGSGNFLTETYLSLRRLENEVISLLYKGQIVMDLGDPIQVSISQFYGIEINDFAVTVAKTALWIAESQMMKETEDVVHLSLDFLPLKTNAHIVEGNALRLDWESVVPKAELDYIMGNPPFVGGMKMTRGQKEDIIEVVGNISGVGEMDYVAAWYYKASVFIDDTQIECAFVSTNSLVQGQQAITVWESLINEKSIKINFAYQTFRWDSEAKIKAHVHCVIVGFSQIERSTKTIYNNTGEPLSVTHINSYLVSADNWFVHAISKPICDVPAIRFGSMPRGKAFIMDARERDAILSKYPGANYLIKPFYMGNEFINGSPRYCLWLVGVSPAELKKYPPIMERLNEIRASRLESKAAATRKLADTPALFAQIAQPTTDYIAVPAVSTQRRRYIPIGFLSKDVIAGNKLYIIPKANLYHFGILTSNVHMAWMRMFAGRMKSDYSYSKDIVYNNFPWPTPTEQQKTKIEQTAQAILDARALYPDSSLADLYDEVTMPPELRRAHQANDKAVMQVYGFDIKTTTETTCVAELMKMYQALTERS